MLDFYFSLKKDYKLRPNYQELLQHQFIKNNEEKEYDMADYVTKALDLPLPTPTKNAK